MFDDAHERVTTARTEGIPDLPDTARTEGKCRLRGGPRGEDRPTEERDAHAGHDLSCPQEAATHEARYLHSVWEKEGIFTH